MCRNCLPLGGLDVVANVVAVVVVLCVVGWEVVTARRFSTYYS